MNDLGWGLLDHFGGILLGGMVLFGLAGLCKLIFEKEQHHGDH